jgi:hypothetical protein
LARKAWRPDWNCPATLNESHPKKENTIAKPTSVLFLIIL